VREGNWGRKQNNKVCRCLSVPPLTLHTLTFSRQHITAMSAVCCAGCGRAFSHPRYRRSHLSQTKNPSCLAVQQALLAPDLVLDTMSPPHSPVLLTPGCSPRLGVQVTPVFADHGQIDFEGKPYHSSNICNEIDSHHGTTSDSEAVNNSSDSSDGNSSANPAGTNDPDGNSSTNDDFDGDPDDPDDDHDSNTHWGQIPIC